MNFFLRFIEDGKPGEMSRYSWLEDGHVPAILELGGKVSNNEISVYATDGSVEHRDKIVATWEADQGRLISKKQYSVSIFPKEKIDDLGIGYKSSPSNLPNTDIGDLHYNLIRIDYHKLSNVLALMYGEHADFHTLRPEVYCPKVLELYREGFFNNEGLIESKYKFVLGIIS